MVIREIQTNDAEAFLNLCHKLDKETQFMMLEPDERTTTVNEQFAQIENIISKDNQTILVAEHNNQLIGYIRADGGRYKRNRHSGYIVMGILQSFIGQGIGTMLLRELERWAIENKIHRLELTVMVHNEAGLALYKKMDFGIEGTKKHSLFINGSYVDEYYMAKLLS
ncbi:MAG: GNAT family N-acetyltransferase [Bacteroidetes bacterium]|nr:GNAT family N-acetyltransferase [Bacteroidota bacterium]MBU1423615.1 GNAT family N-acetyltransferase [Bacteroidota bacterium]MBU2471659.1 GNAT family N-acetyltransferase [Bacteroidota bacterium]MBU2636196.1 GNAT family N-acetyltransferase [Bacteroidota bacterium]